jgi:hypothetical protein
MSASQEGATLRGSLRSFGWEASLGTTIHRGNTDARRGDA